MTEYGRVPNEPDGYPAHPSLTESLTDSQLAMNISHHMHNITEFQPLGDKNYFLKRAMFGGLDREQSVVDLLLNSPIGKSMHLEFVSINFQSGDLLVAVTVKIVDLRIPREQLEPTNSLNAAERATYNQAMELVTKYRERTAAFKKAQQTVQESATEQNIHAESMAYRDLMFMQSELPDHMQLIAELCAILFRK